MGYTLHIVLAEKEGVEEVGDVVRNVLAEGNTLGFDSLSVDSLV